MNHVTNILQNDQFFQWKANPKCEDFGEPQIAFQWVLVP